MLAGLIAEQDAQAKEVQIRQFRQLLVIPSLERSLRWD
jgi:hypothetical protein